MRDVMILKYMRINHKVMIKGTKLLLIKSSCLNNYGVQTALYLHLSIKFL